MVSPLFILAFYAAYANAHLAVWSKGMYCRNGPQDADDQNASAPTRPLYMMTKSRWWFHHENNCDLFPPPEGEFLEIPAGKDFTVEIAANRATTTLSYNGKYTSDWVDGQPHTDAFRGSNTCITNPNIHTQNENNAAGTAFAISYQSDLSKVTADNLVVFSVRYHTPWKRLTTYSVPAALPACPPGGCICAWGWVPNGCGEPNMYHQGFKCKVTGATSTNPVAVAKPPVWCEGDSSKCTTGAKQMIYWHQLDGNNINVSGQDLSGQPKSPAYNQKAGFPDGAQNDIFAAPSKGGNADIVDSGATNTTAAPSPTRTASAVSVSHSSSSVQPPAASSVQPPAASSVQPPAASSVQYPAASSVQPPAASSSPIHTSSASQCTTHPRHRRPAKDKRNHGPMAAHRRRRIDSSSW